MNEEELKSFIINFISKKENESEDKNFIRYTFFELKVIYNLSENEIDELLKISRDYFQNKGYNVYFTGAKYKYKNTDEIVKSNEVLIAIKI